jgi:DNA end-binding protein Ku
VAYEHIVKGYEYEKDKYVVLTDEELESVPVESSRAIDILQFVDAEEIDPIYYKKSYYLVPEETGVKAYRLLREAMAEDGRVGIAKVSFRDKEHLSALRFSDDVLVLETMYWPDEIRDAKFEELDKDAKLRPQEVQMARTLIENLTEDWNPEQYQDEYRNALLEMVDKKVAGEEIEFIEAPEPTKVVDLMEALKASVEAAKKPAALVERLRPGDAGLGVDLDDGRRMARCTRCDVWIATTPPATPVRQSLPSVDDIKLPRRGQVLRDAIVLRLIAIDRAIHSVLFAALAVLLFLLETNLGSLRTDAQRLIANLTANTGQGASQGTIDRWLHDILGIQKHTLLILLFTAIAYAVVEGVEAVGLWREKRWAEYLTAIATAGFLPFEVHELTKKVTVLRIGALVVNVAILAWLVWRKRLFGARGGVAAEHREEEFDRRELFGPPAHTRSGQRG